jgi:hypothetical protein
MFHIYVVNVNAHKKTLLVTTQKENKNKTKHEIKIIQILIAELLFIFRHILRALIFIRFLFLFFQDSMCYNVLNLHEKRHVQLLAAPTASFWWGKYKLKRTLKIDVVKVSLTY